MTETSPAREREKRSNTAHLFIRAVPAERRFICRKRQQTEPRAGDPGRRVLALSGQGARTRGSAGQAPSLSQLHLPFTGRPRVPAKLRPGFAQPRWPPRIYKKARYRNISSAAVQMQTHRDRARSPAAGEWPMGAMFHAGRAAWVQVVGPQRAEAGHASPPAAAAFPQLPPVSRQGPAPASESSGRRVRLDGAKSGGKETPSLSPEDQLSSERGPRLSQLITAGGT